MAGPSSLLLGSDSGRGHLVTIVCVAALSWFSHAEEPNRPASDPGVAPVVQYCLAGAVAAAPEIKDTTYWGWELAETLARLGDVPGARGVAAQFPKDHDRAVAHWRIARQQVLAGDLVGATESAGLITMPSNRGNILRLVAAAWLDRGNHEAARAALAAALRALDPLTEDCRRECRHLAVVQAKAGDRVGALATLARVAQAANAYDEVHGKVVPDAYLKVGDALLRRGDYAGAIAAAGVAEGARGSAQPLLAAIGEAAARSPTPAATVAAVLAEGRRAPLPAGALGTLATACAQVAPRSAAPAATVAAVMDAVRQLPKGSQRVETLGALAEACARAGERALALTVLAAAQEAAAQLRAEPEPLPPWSEARWRRQCAAEALARARVALGDVPGGLASAAEVGVDELLLQTCYRLVEALVEAGDRAGAQMVFDVVAARTPLDSEGQDLLEQRLRLQVLIGDTDGAVAAAQATPAPVQRLTEVAKFLLAAGHREAGLAALRQAARLAAREREHRDSWLGCVAELQCKACDLAGAEATLQLLPVERRADYYVKLAEARADVGDVAGALAAAALAQDQAWFGMYMNIGRAQWAAGDVVGARASFAKAFDLTENGPCYGFFPYKYAGFVTEAQAAAGDYDGALALMARLPHADGRDNLFGRADLLQRSGQLTAARELLARGVAEMRRTGNWYSAEDFVRAQARNGDYAFLAWIPEIPRAGGRAVAWLAAVNALAPPPRQE